MYHRLPKKQKIIRLVTLYTSMVLTVAITVTIIVAVMLGFRFNSNSGNLEQNAFLQFDSTPSGATVMVGKKVVNSQTPNKTSIIAGRYEIVMMRDGYETWRKTVDVKSGILTWINYVLLIPNKLNIESLINFDTVTSTLTAPDNRRMLIQTDPASPTFDLVDISSDNIKSTKITIPEKSYSDSSIVETKHSFKIDRWDQGGRYVIVQHIFNNNTEWLVFDTQDVTQTKNITKLFDFDFSNIRFAGSGNSLFAIDSKDLRKLDLSAGTISKLLVTNITSFELYDSNIITYIGTNDVGEKIIGIYKDGNDNPYILRTIADLNIPTFVLTTNYFNEDYIVITEGKKVDILSGSYQNILNDNAANIKLLTSFDVKSDISNISFSPTGQYLFVQSGDDFASYDIEYQNLTSSTIDNTDARTPLKWINDSYLWSDNGGSLTIREFDGANAHNINLVVAGQDVALSRNGVYLYSINKSDAGGFQLQRVRMILP